MASGRDGWIGEALRRRWLSGTVSAIAIVVAAAAAAPAMAQQGNPPASQTERRITLDIPPQDLNGAILAFADKAGIQVFFDSARVQGLRSNGVMGEVTVGEALTRILSGTGLTYRFTGANAVALETLPQTGEAAPGVIQLGPVRIEGEAGSSRAAISVPPPAYAGGQVGSGGGVGLLGNIPVMDTPFNQTSYTSELIENQQAKTIGDVLDNDPSIRRAWPASGFYEYFQIRGFNVNSQDISFNGLYGMVPRYGGVPVDFAERVEVLKGPSALLNGMSPNGVIGGAINIVPKRAGDDPLTRLTVGLDSDSLFGAHLDVGRRFGPTNEWGVRINASLQDGDTYIDGQSKNGSNTESIALDYRGDRLRLALDAFRIEDRNHGGASMAVSIGSGLTAMPSAPSGSTNISPWGTGTARTGAVVLSGEYNITDHVTAYADVTPVFHPAEARVLS